MIKAVIFDVDGTLVDSVDLHAKAWQEAFLEFGKTIDFKTVREQIGKGGDQLLPTFLTKAEIEEYGEQLTEFRGEHFKKNYIDQIKAFAKVRDLFKIIKASGKKIAIGTSAKKDELSHYLKVAKIDDLVDVKTSADDVEKSKPFPDIFAVALDKLNLPPENVVVIGDSPYDAEAASKIDLLAIGFLCGGNSADVLRGAGATTIYDGPEDLFNNFTQSALAAPH